MRKLPLIAAIAAMAWMLFAFIIAYYIRPIHLMSSWPWFTTPAWLRDFQNGWNSFPTEVFVQGGLWLVILVATLMLGWALLRNERSNLESAVMGSGLVLGGLGTLVFIFGIAGLIAHSRIVFAAALIGMLIAGLVGVIRKKEYLVELRQILRFANLSRAEAIVLLVIFALQLIALLYALTPSIQSDELRYHLAAPQEWLKMGHLGYLPYNAFSNFPSTIDMLFLFGSGLAGDLLAKGFHLFFLPLTTGAIALILNEIMLQLNVGNARIAGLRPGFLAALIWSTTPSVVLPFSGWAFIEMGLLFFTLAMAYYLLRWVRTRRTGDWVLSAVFAGLLSASKYTGMPAAALAGFLLLITGILAPGGRRSIPASLLRFVLFGLISMAIVAPWLIKNVIYTGNPVYPLASKIFKGGEWTDLNQQIYAEKLKQKGEGTSFKAFARLPYTTFSNPFAFESFEIGAFYWVMTPWILAAVLFALFCARSHPGPAVLSILLVFLLFFWFFTYQSNRFLLPVLALGVVGALASFILSALHHPRLRNALFILLIFPIAYNAVDSLRWFIFSSGSPWPAYTLGFLSRSDYLANKLNYARIAEYASATLGPNDKVLLVGEHRKMHWKCAVEGSDWYDQPRILPFLRQSKDSDSLIDLLKQNGFTLIFFNLQEWGWPMEDHPAPRFSTAWWAWFYNSKYFNTEDIAKLKGLINSPRLIPVLASQPGQVYLVRIQ